MKRLLIALLLLSALIPCPQKYVYKVDVYSISFKAIETDYINGRFVDVSEWKDTPVNLLMVVDVNKGIIRLSNEARSVYTIIDLSDRTDSKGRDKDGDTYETLEWRARDEENKRCRIALRAWDDYNIVQLYVHYNDISICYEGETK